jgi:hypothetical protein
MPEIEGPRQQHAQLCRAPRVGYCSISTLSPARGASALEARAGTHLASGRNRLLFFIFRCVDERIAIALIGGVVALIVLVYFVLSINQVRKRGQWRPPDFDR